MRFRFCRDFKPYFGAYAASNKVALKKIHPLQYLVKAKGMPISLSLTQRRWVRDSEIGENNISMLFSTIKIGKSPQSRWV